MRLLADVQVLFIGTAPAARAYARTQGLHPRQVHSVTPDNPGELSRIVLGRTRMEVVASGEWLGGMAEFFELLRHTQATWDAIDSKTTTGEAA